MQDRDRFKYMQIREYNIWAWIKLFDSVKSEPKKKKVLAKKSTIKKKVVKKIANKKSVWKKKVN